MKQCHNDNDDNDDEEDAYSVDDCALYLLKETKKFRRSRKNTPVPYRSWNPKSL